MNHGREDSTGARASRGDRLHLHAVWSWRPPSATRELHDDYDLASDGSGWNQGGRVLNRFVGESGFEPDLAVDPLGAGPGDTPVTVVHRDLLGQIKLTRSEDSGATWLDPPLAMNDATDQGLPAIDPGSAGGVVGLAFAVPPPCP